MTTPPPTREERLPKVAKEMADFIGNLIHGSASTAIYHIEVNRPYMQGMIERYRLALQPDAADVEETKP